MTERTSVAGCLLGRNKAPVAVEQDGADGAAVGRHAMPR